MAAKYSPENERIKRQYLAYLQEAKRYSEHTVDAVAKALNRFEEYTRYRSFTAFHYEQAVAFKRHLAEQKGLRTGEKLSKATLHATLSSLKNFFFWLAGQPGYRGHFQYSDADYFNISEKERRVATAHRERRSPTLEQVRHVLQTMPAQTEVERRNRALVAFALLTGARDSAIASMKLKHVDMVEGCVHQDAREVKTKFSKTFTTYFFPVGGDARQIVEDWVRYLVEQKLWGSDDPLFPATRIALGTDGQFAPDGLEQTHWSNATPIRAIFRKAFERAGLPYFNPHSFRKTLARLGEEVCNSPEDFKAWSQNLGHEQVLTTFTSYGAVATDRQGAIIKGLNKEKTPQLQSGADDIAEAVFRKLQQAGANLPAAL
jgi:integrase